MCVSEMFWFINRYFTGHTDNSDGIAPFKAGKTKIGDAVNGTIRIVTVAVCVLTINGLSAYAILYLHIH